jgi:hypothetical protein
VFGTENIIFSEIFRKMFFPIFYGYRGSAANLGYACKKLGGLGPLVWEKIENGQTVHKTEIKGDGNN